MYSVKFSVWVSKGSQGAPSREAHMRKRRPASLLGVRSVGDVPCPLPSPGGHAGTLPGEHFHPMTCVLPLGRLCSASHSSLTTWAILSPARGWADGNRVSHADATFLCVGLTVARALETLGFSRLFVWISCSRAPRI